MISSRNRNTQTNRKEKILIVGGGKGGKALLDIFSTDPLIEIVGLVDIDENASAVKLAKSLGIRFSSHWNTFIKEDIDIIFNVTGKVSVQTLLESEVRNRGITVIDGASAKFIWRILEERRRVEEAIRLSNLRFEAVLRGLDAYIYVSDMQTYEILYANEKLKELFGDVVGEKCYKVLQEAQDGPCSFCTNFKLIDSQGNPTGVVVWDFQNTKTKRWYSCRDQAIPWPDGRLVRMEIAFDITERKAEENILNEVNGALLELGADPRENIQKLLHTFQKIIGKCICVWSREEKYGFKVIEGANLPPNFPLVYPKEGNPCSEIVVKKANYPLVVDIENSPYRDNELIKNMGVKTYLGTFVSVGRVFRGVLCAFFKERREFTPFQLYITAILSRAFQNEEERRFAQEKLIKAYQMSKNILDRASFGIYIVNKAGKVEYANQAMLDISGDTREAFMDLDVFNLEGYKRIGLDKKIRECLGGSYFKVGPLEYTSLKGKTTVRNFIGIPLKEDNEEKAIIVVEDVTEEKRMEKELQKRASLIENIIENAHSIILVVDKEGNILTINRFLENLTGYSREEILGKNWCDIFVPSSFQDQVRKAFKQALVGKTFRDFRAPLLNREKGELEISWDSSVLRGTQESVLGLILFGYDITEKKKVEQAQRLARLGELVSDMAHEVNNPLMIISGRAQLALMEEIKNREVEKALRIIVEQSLRAKDIIQRLLLFSRPSKGVVKEVDINRCIEGVVELVEHQFFLRNVKIVKKYKSLPEVKVDEKQIQEVIMNLLKNSYDAMRGGGTITISTFREGDMIKIVVADTGEGMSEDVLAKLFEPFFTTKEQGTGLGLSLCYGIIKAHNGDLQFESTLGKGTKATISLPLK